MGVKGLIPFLRKAHPRIFKEVPIAAYDGKTLALDSTLWISRCYFSSYDKRQGLHRWHDILGRLRMNGVEPICIFDGPSRPKQKHLTNLSRATKREEAGTRLETERQIQRHLASLEEAASLPEEEKRVAYSSTLSLLRDAIVEAPEPALIPSPPVPLPPPVTPEPKLHRDHRQLVAFLEPLISQDKPAEESELEAVEAELTALGLQSADRKVRFGRAAHAMPSEFTQACIALSRAFGFPTYLPPHEIDREGEELACSLFHHGSASGVGSRDSDVLAHGARLVGGIANTLDPLAPSPLVVVDPAAIQTALRLTEAQFLDYCILIGTDYPGHLYNVGPKTALKLLHEHGDIEAIVAKLQKDRKGRKKLGDLDVGTYLEELPGVRAIFSARSPPPSIDLERKEPDWREVDELLDRFEEQVDNPLAYRPAYRPVLFEQV